MSSILAVVNMLNPIDIVYVNKNNLRWRIYLDDFCCLLIVETLMYNFGMFKILGIDTKAMK